MYSIGIDCGSVATKGVLFDGRNIIKQIVIATGWSPKQSSKKVLDYLACDIESGQIKGIVGTGYGRVSMDFANKKVTEITCHAKGIHFLNPNVRTILDIGGQDSKVIKLDENGNVCDFMMNDKCAAGTGRFIQIMMNLLDTDIKDIDNLARGAKPQIISNMCTVFAESEVVSLLAQGESVESVASGILFSVCNKASTMLDKMGYEDLIAFSGGVSKSSVLVDMINEKLGVDIYVSENSQFVGALGAACIGYK